MSDDTEAVPAAGVRSLERWGVPFHYVVPATVAVIGWLLLAAGGAVAFAGGWWLVVALPIAIGSFLEDPRVAAAPVVVWIAWVIIAAVAGSDAGVAHTPFALAVALGAVGAVATRVAQFAIFPATAREAWEPALHKLGGAADEDGDAAPDASAATDDAVTLPELDMTQMTVTFEALEPIGTAEHAELSEAADVDVAADAALLDAAAAVEAAAVEAATETESKPEPDAEADKPDPEASPPDAAAENEAEPEPEPGPEAPAPEPAPKVVHVELPLDADPAELDEGGHVTEFRAITEADVLAATDPGSRAEAQPGSDVP